MSTPPSSHNGVHELAEAFEAVLTNVVEKTVGPAVDKAIGPAFDKAVGPAVEKVMKPFEKRFDDFENTIVELLDDRDKKLEARMVTLENNVQNQIAAQHQSTISQVTGMLSVIGK